MSLLSDRATAIFKTRLALVSYFTKTNLRRQVPLNTRKLSQIPKEEFKAKCCLLKESLSHPDSLEKFHDCNQFLDLKLQEYKFSAQSTSNLENNAHIYLTRRCFSLPSKPPAKSSASAEPKLPASIDIKPSKTEQLKKAFTEYGPTIMAFHLAISMISLGGFYALLSGGMDIAPILEFLGVSSSALAEKVATGSTFVMAFAIHKVLAPIRISITLGATPLVVRYLRTKGLMKAKT